MKFKTRMINAAVAAALGTLAGSAQALAPPLDFGLYRTAPQIPISVVEAGTYFSIINSDSVPVSAVKVRFINDKVSLGIGGGSSNFVNNSSLAPA